MLTKIISAVVIITLALLALTSCGTIESGNVGVRTTFGKVNPEEVEGFAKADQIIKQSLTREYLQHESNLALQKFAGKGGTAKVVIPANMQTAPLINFGAR